MTYDSNQQSPEAGDSGAALEALAGMAGISVHWDDARGIRHTVSHTTLRALLNALGLGCDSPEHIADSMARAKAAAEYASDQQLLIAEVNAPVRLPVAAEQTDLRYTLELENGEQREGEAQRESPLHVEIPGIAQMGYHRLKLGGRSYRMAIAPARCYSIADATGQDRPRVWGLTAQLYSLRSACALPENNCRGNAGGVGDFGALAELARKAGELGAQAIGISPTHAMFAAAPERSSPYSPSSRLFLNTIYANPWGTFDNDKLEGLAAEIGVANTLAALEKTRQIDWTAVSRARTALLRALFLRREDFFTPELRAEFDTFRRRGGTALEDHARFEVMDQVVGRAPENGGYMSWHAWPMALRDPRSTEVAALAEKYADEVTFHIFMQWLAERSLAAAQTAAREAGMAVGIIADLAVGTSHDGSQAWGRQREILQGLSCGAPPDIFNPLGQSWGLAVFSPHALRVTGFAPFLEMLRATMAHAGGIRVDHVLGLQRLWLVPGGASASEGAYLSYPVDEMFHLVALESWRHRCVVVGENLGTLPHGFNTRMEKAGIMGTSVLWFERHDNRFIQPRHWPAANMATTTTHDLPSVRGWWAGRDIYWRGRLSLFANAQGEDNERGYRWSEKNELWNALREAGLAQGDIPPEDQAPLEASIAYVGQSSAPLVVIPMEDICGVIEQPNLPGTVSGHPNWQQRLPGHIDAIFDDAAARHRIEVLKQARNRSLENS